MPQPRVDEQEQDFLYRCITELIEDEDRTAEQATAICHDLWDENKMSISKEDYDCD